MNGLKEKIENLSKRDVAGLQRAINIAELSSCKQRHGAVIIKGGNVVGFGFNTMRNEPHTDIPSDVYSIHAEVAALRSVKSYRSIGKINAPGIESLTGSKIYVARISRRGNTALSRPCDVCYTELVKSGIAEVIYTT